MPYRLRGKNIQTTTPEIELKLSEFGSAEFPGGGACAYRLRVIRRNAVSYTREE